MKLYVEKYQVVISTMVKINQGNYFRVDDQEVFPKWTRMTKRAIDAKMWAGTFETEEKN